MPIIKSLATENLSAKTHANDVLAQYTSTRMQTVALCQPLETEDFVVQPIDDVSPPKWHLAHTTWFFENFVLCKFNKSYKPFHPKYHYIFNSYYQSQGERIVRSKRGTLSRPTVADVLKYRKYVDEHMHQFINKNADNLPEKAGLFIEIGLHHEQQHQELLVYDIKYILGSNPLLPKYFKSERLFSIHNKSKKTNPLSFSTIPAGKYQIGKNGETFCFDNEMGQHTVYLEAFKIANCLTTNADFLEFIEDDGYKNFNFWLDDGWHWKTDNNIKSPLYWRKNGNTWYEFTMYGLQKLNLNAPVCHISYFEADAYAKWKNMRLPTEQEWEIACKTLEPIIPKNANLAEKNIYQPHRAIQANKQFYGDVWEWTNSAYLPYPNYKKQSGALGEYNGKFMSGQMVLRGGACATPQSHIRLTYRNFFYPQQQWMFSGIRLAENH